jgi:regulator of protease activity HflC (stomatin/prohibitin superfamily)
MFLLGIFAGLLAYLLYLVPQCSFRVLEGHVGVVTTFGAAMREQGGKGNLRLFQPGLHFKLPWQKARSVPLMEEIIDLSGAEGARTAMAEDGTTLRLDAVLRYLPAKDELYNFVFDLAAPREHITGLFTCLLRNEIANFRAAAPDEPPPDTPGGSYALLQSQRRRLNEEIMSYCKDEIGPQYGVRFSAVDLVDIRPPEELDEALNAAVHAQMDAETTYAHAEAAAERRIIAAKRGVEIAEMKALATEEEIGTLVAQLEELSREKTLDLYVARRSAEVLSQSRQHYVRRPL